MSWLGTVTRFVASRYRALIQGLAQPQRATAELADTVYRSCMQVHAKITAVNRACNYFPTFTKNSPLLLFSFLIAIRFCTALALDLYARRRHVGENMQGLKVAIKRSFTPPPVLAALMGIYFVESTFNVTYIVSKLIKYCSISVSRFSGVDPWLDLIHWSPGPPKIFYPHFPKFLTLKRIHESLSTISHSNPSEYTLNDHPRP